MMMTWPQAMALLLGLIALGYILKTIAKKGGEKWLKKRKKRKQKLRN